MSTLHNKLKLVTDEGRPSALGWGLGGGLLAVIAAVVTLTVIYLRVDVPLPDAAPGGRPTVVLDTEGNPIGDLKGVQKRQIVPLDEMATDLQHAVVATEDRGFYDHSGISLRGTLRALFSNVQAGGVAQGGSTITQQYARNAFAEVGRERTLGRKLKEISVARRIERTYSKDKILEFYLNTIYFGRGAYGAQAAALTYFKKPATDLTLSEAAYLAGAIRAPEHFQPDENPDAAVRIRNQVLRNMVATGHLPDQQARQEEQIDLLEQFQLGPTELDSPRAGFFLEHVRRLLRTEEFGFTDAEVLGGGLTVRTSLDLQMQDAAEAAVASVLDQPDDPEVALVAMDPQGHVRAMVGGRQVQDRERAFGFNYAVGLPGQSDSGRQAGSAFKAVALASYLQQGEAVTRRFPGPGTITIDSRLCRDGSGQSWSVSNYDGRGYGSLDITSATASSVNTVYAQIMSEVVSPSEFMDTAGDLGIEIPSRDEGCALALGTTPVTAMQMARAFTTFAARGQRPEVLMVTEIVNSAGRVLFQRSARSARVLDAAVADTVNLVLEQVVTSGTGRGAAIGRPAAGKTGTTQNHVDAWFAGYTPDLTAVVWVGHAPDESGRIPEMIQVRGGRVTGGGLPASVWREFMVEALRGVPASSFVRPAAAARPATPDCPSGSVRGPENECVPMAPEDPAPFTPLPPPEFEPLPPAVPVPTFTTPAPSPTPTVTVTPAPSPSPTATPTVTPSPSPTLTPDPD